MEICFKSFSKFLMLARDCAQNIIASHEQILYWRQKNKNEHVRWNDNSQFLSLNYHSLDSKKQMILYPIFTVTISLSYTSKLKSQEDLIYL